VPIKEKGACSSVGENTKALSTHLGWARKEKAKLLSRRTVSFREGKKYGPKCKGSTGRSGGEEFGSGVTKIGKAVGGGTNNTGWGVRSHFSGIKNKVAKGRALEEESRGEGQRLSEKKRIGQESTSRSEIRNVAAGSTQTIVGGRTKGRGGKEGSKGVKRRVSLG